MARLPTYATASSLESINEVHNEFSQLSGMVASVNNVGIIWAHNDGATTSDGGLAFEFCAIRRNGNVVGRYTTHSSAVGSGFEDMALGPGPIAGASYLYFGSYLGRSGNAPVNNGKVIRVQEPTITETGGYQGTAGSIDCEADLGFVPKQLRFSFADGQGHTSECLLCDPTTGDLYIVCKGLQNSQQETGKIFKFAYPQSTTATTSIPLVADLDMGPDNTFTLPVTHDDAGQVPARSQITAGDVSPDGEWIVIRSRAEDAFVWRRDPGSNLEDAWGSGAASNRKGAGALPIRLASSQEAVCFANYNHVSGNGTDGWPGGIYGTAEGGQTLWWAQETVQPDPDGAPPPPPVTTGWRAGGGSTTVPVK